MRIKIACLLAALLLAAPCLAADVENELYLFVRKMRTIEAVKKYAPDFRSEGLSLERLPSAWPVDGIVTSNFGMRKSPFSGQTRMHNGIDIGAPAGTIITAPADGIVILAGRANGYGNTIDLYHTSGVTTRFGHMLALIAREGQRVKKGDIIGLVGSTGMSTGPHLHYEVLLKGTPVNPLRYIL